MPYVIENDTTLPRVVASGTDSDGNEYSETERVSYSTGQVVYEDDIAPDFLERLESGDNEHLQSLVKHVSESEAQRLLAEQGGSDVVAPEHEAEAEVLSQDGKDVLTREEVVESNPNGDVVAEEEEEPDLSEGREPEDDETIRSTEVDKERRGEGDAPEPKPAAKEKSKRSRSKKSDDKDES